MSGCPTHFHEVVTLSQRRIGYPCTQHHWKRDEAFIWNGRMSVEFWVCLYCMAGARETDGFDPRVEALS